MKTRSILFSILLSGLLLATCSTSDRSSSIEDNAPYQPEWTKSANIYEVNVRQYTPEGTFNAFREEMPRLSQMGVDILWFMPVHPIGEVERKGSLGSYYAVKDYTGINPNFGTMDDFKALVSEAHALGMKVIIDWVPNHTAWDHPWTSEHPEYYAKDEEGNITYEADWSDIALLDYTASKELWIKMTDAMSYWITEADIDGFRVDHAAHEIPMEYWYEAIPAVDELKEDLFWLAEWHGPELFPTFDASYAWDYFHLTTSIGRGDTTFAVIDGYMDHIEEEYPENAYQMYFTSNHDENSWNGTDEQLFGDNFENFAVMAATIDGFFLVYSGQESGIDKQLEFFEKDAIEWADYKYEDFYSQLFKLIDENEALWNGAYGGDFERVDSPDGTYSYVRTKGDNQVFVALNNTGDEQEFVLPAQEIPGFGTFGSATGSFGENGYTIVLPANQWFILTTN